MGADETVDTGKTVDVDPGMNKSVTDDQFTIGLTTGISLVLDYKTTDWEKICTDSAEDTFNNIEAAKLMIRDIMTESDPIKRDNLSAEAIRNIIGLYDSIGAPNDINYDLRENITLPEKAVMYLMDGIIIMTEMIHAAQIYMMTESTSGMSINQLIEEMSSKLTGIEAIEDGKNPFGEDGKFASDAE
jgi:hypothetical protein